MKLNQFLGAKFPTCIQQINHPVHNGVANPYHGHFFIVGTIPGDCYDSERGKSKTYPTLEDCKTAIVAAGVNRFQLPDCSWFTTHQATP